jgi:hypothetical protein
LYRKRTPSVIMRFVSVALSTFTIREANILLSLGFLSQEAFLILSLR